MASILDKILADKRAEVEAGKAATSLDELKGRIAGMSKCRNFYKAVTKRKLMGVNVIAEVKKASPSAGLIREDFDAVEIAKVYEKCGAAAISVLTDEKYFGGKLEYLTAVKGAVSLPVLRKDFIIDEWQIYQARAAGADAVLLIAEALKGGVLMDLMILAGELSMTVLLEVHDVDLLLSVRSLIGFPKEGYSVLGINNRDLGTMEVDINNCIRMAELIDGGKRRFVAESGIKSWEDVVSVKRAGACAVLIGESLCSSGDIEKKYKEIFRY